MACMSILPPSPFLSSAHVAETLPAEASGKGHPSAGSSFSIDEDSFFYAIDPPPLEGIEAIEIEQILSALFASNQ